MDRHYLPAHRTDQCAMLPWVCAIEAEIGHISDYFAEHKALTLVQKNFVDISHFT